MNQHTNKVRIRAVARALAGLSGKSVFVGGATISLYPDKPIGDVRPTDDVDVIMEILNYAERAALEEKLRSHGFSHDVESGIVCRYRIQGIVVDILPTNDASIGFSNLWYPQGFEKAMLYDIDEWNKIYILTAPYFIATKLEAHKSRGEGDGRTSQDFEDIIFILENRSSIWKEMSEADEALRKYLKEEFRQLWKNPDLFEWIDSNVERTSPPATYIIMEQIEKFIS